MEYKCVLCGKEMWYSSQAAYFERGLSENLFLCEKCRQHKVTLLDYNAANECISASQKYMEGLVAGKVVEIQKVVKGWISGEIENYFPVPDELVYYVEGPEAYLFVFEDRLVVLSSSMKKIEPRIHNKDVRILFYDDKGNKDICYFEDDKQEVKDVDKLNYRVASNRHYLMSEDKANYHNNEMYSFEQNYPKLLRMTKYKPIYWENIKYNLDEKMPIELERSYGEYGKLNFRYLAFSMNPDVFTFKFFYHQNQLLEEIYNYIQQRIALNGKEKPAKSEDEVELEIRLRRRKAMESKKEIESETFSLADEISKLKGLLDCGVLTQEEFDDAKKKLIAKV